MDKFVILGFFAFTWIIDIIWCLYWAPFWRSDIMKDWERGIHNFVIIMSVIGLIYKFVIMVVMFLAEMPSILRGNDRVEREHLNY